MNAQPDFNTLKLMARKSLGAYASMLHPDWAPNWHHRVIANVMERVASGDPEYRKVCIQMPPRAGKSEIVSKIFPGWYLAQHPYHTVINASYGAELADEMGRKAREYATSEVFKTLFDVEVSKLTNAITKWDLTNHGRYFSTSVGSALTGMGANILTIDDPIKNFDDAMSQTVKDKIWDWFVSTAYTRLEKGGAVLAIMTRWAVDDLVGRLLASDSGWKNITFPMIATRDEKYRKKGEPLWPEKFDLQKCEEIKSTVGRQVWSSLYQQSPVPEGGAIFKEEYFRYYDPNDLHSLYFSAIYQSWDTGVSKKNTSARSSCTTWGVVHNENLPGNVAFYLLDVYAHQLNFPELRAKAKELINEWDPDIVWVEEEQTGRPLIDELRMIVGSKLVPVRPKGQKESRAQAISAIFESGRVVFPLRAPWLENYKEELLSFPFGEYKDNVDSTTQAIRQMVKQEYSAGRRRMNKNNPDWMVPPKAPSVFWR